MNPTRFPKALTHAAFALLFVLLAILGWWLASMPPSVPNETDSAPTVASRPSKGALTVITEPQILLKTSNTRIQFPANSTAIDYSPSLQQWLVLQSVSTPVPPTDPPTVPPPPPIITQSLLLCEARGTVLKTITSLSAQRDQHIACAAFAPLDLGGNFVLFASPTGVLRLWNLDADALAWALPTKLPIQNLAFSPDGKTVALAVAGGIHLLNTESRVLSAVLRGHSGDVTKLHFVGNSRLVSGANDRTLKYWDVSTHSMLRSLEAHTQPITSLDVSPDGDYALSGGADARIILWNLSDGTIRWRYRGPQDFRYGSTGTITGTVFINEGVRFLTTTSESADLWDFATHQHLVTYFCGRMGPPTVLAGQREFAGTDYNFVFPIPDNEAVPDGVGPSEPPSPGRELRTFRLENRTEGAASVAFTPTGPHALVNDAAQILLGADNSDGKPTFLRVNLQSGEATDFAAHNDRVYPSNLAAISSDGTLAAAISRGEVRIVDPSTGKNLRTCIVEPSMTAPLGAVAFSADNKLLAVAQTPWSHDNKPEILIYNVEDGSRANSLRGATDRIRALAFSPDGKLLLAAGGSGDLGPIIPPKGISVLPEGSLQHCDVRVFEVSTGRLLHTLSGHIRQITSIVVSADSKRALTVAEFGDTPILWDLETGAEILRLHPHINRGRAANITALALSPNGQYAATGGEDCDIRVYDIQTSVRVAPPVPLLPEPKPTPVTYPPEIARFEQHRAAITVLRFLPDNKTLVSASADNSLRLWQLP
jgi:WD40 repeat protein